MQQTGFVEGFGCKPLLSRTVMTPIVYLPRVERLASPDDFQDE